MCSLENTRKIKISASHLISNMICMNYDHNKKFGLLKFHSGYGKFNLNSPQGYSRKIFNAQTGEGVPRHGAKHLLTDGHSAKDVCVKQQKLYFATTVALQIECCLDWHLPYNLMQNRHILLCMIQIKWVILYVYYPPPMK